MSTELSNLMDGLEAINPYSGFLSDMSYERYWIDTGSLLLNSLISGSTKRGIPSGKVIQFAGPSQTFKTGFILRILANAQKMGKKIIILDTEGAIEEEDAKRVGLDASKIIYVRPESVESARNSLYKIFKNIRANKMEGEVLIALDSIANMITETELKKMDEEKTTQDMGLFAKAIKSLLKVANTGASQTNTTVLCTNHVYDDPSEMYPSLEKHLAGGKAVIYLPTVTVQLARKAAKDGEVKGIEDESSGGQKGYSGVLIRLLTIKNRIIKQYLTGEVYLSFKKGLDKYHGLLDVMKELGVVVSKGATWEDWEGNKLGYYKSWRKDESIWEKLIEKYNDVIETEWTYSSVGDEDGEDELEMLDSIGDNEEETN